MKLLNLISKARKGMRKAVSILLSPVKENLLFFAMMYLLGMITTFTHVIELNFKIPRINFFTWVFDIYLLCIILNLTPRRFRKWLSLLFAGILYVLAIVDAFCVDKFSARLGAEIVNLIFETDSRESSEFLDKYLHWDVLLSSVGLIVLLVCIHVAGFCHHRKTARLSNWLFGLSAVKVAAVLGILVSIWLSYPSRLSLIRFMSAKSLTAADAIINNHTFNTPINNLLFGLKMRQLADVELGKMANYQYHVKTEHCDYTSPHIVLVIGESYIKKHSQLYGYDKPTTPRQLQRTQGSGDGLFVPFSNVISPANLTSLVFKNVFSLHSIDDTTSWAKFALFPVVFRQAGYQVTFITNQFVKSINRDVFDASGGMFLNDSRLDKLQFDHRNTQSHRYDIDLLADYDSLKQYNQAHNLTIFHLVGQHIDFYKRCPDDQRTFQAKDYSGRTDLNNNERQLIADYDNATLYNDLVVDSIISTFAQDDAIVIYMPDHGDECFDGIHRMGRMPQGNYSPIMAENEYKIPFWIWCSTSYCKKHPDITEQIIAAKDRPFMTDDLPHLLLYLAGIRCKDYNERKNLISPVFDSTRKRLLNGKVDFDSLVTE